MLEPTTEPTGTPIISGEVNRSTAVSSAVTDVIVHGFASVLSAAECGRAVAENPQPAITEPDPLKARIIAMLTECTGVDILDSGGKDNRGWQRNRHIADWDAIDACSIEVYGDNEVIPAYHIYPYLCNFLDITDDSERLNNVLQEIVRTSENSSYLADMEQFIELDEVDITGDSCHEVINTYNYENLLSTVLQYGIFEVEGESYIILQVHLGMDVRGGYTKPQIYHIENPDYFSMAQQDVNTDCDCSNFYSDDAGAHYYLDGSCPSPEPEWIYNTEDNTITCRKCGGNVRFGVIESV